MRLINKKFGVGLAFAVLTKLFYRNLLELIVLRKNYLEIWILPCVLVTISKCLKMSSFFGFKSLSDITAIDQLEKAHRFRLDYNLLSAGKRLIIGTFVSELEFCNSLTRVFSSANWLEREIWDLYGVYFLNHGDLRRILTDYGFRGYPFRKDFPLTGYIELRFDDSRGDVVYEPVELTQELRFFNFATGWEVD